MTTIRITDLDENGNEIQNDTATLPGANFTGPKLKDAKMEPVGDDFVPSCMPAADLSGADLSKNTETIALSLLGKSKPLTGAEMEELFDLEIDQGERTFLRNPNAGVEPELPPSLQAPKLEESAPAPKVAKAKPVELPRAKKTPEKPAPAPVEAPKPVELPRVEAAPVEAPMTAEAFRATLPATATCPKCEKRHSIDKFGIRVMNGPAVKAGKAKPIFRRQSYCGLCRRS